MANKKNIDSSGARLAQARRNAGFNRKEAAELFGWHYDTLTSHEGGRRNFDRETAIKYGRAYGVDPDYLLAEELGRAEDEGAPTRKKRMNLSYDLSSLLPKKQKSESEEISTANIPVHGISAGGLWLEGEFNPFEEDNSTIPAAVGYPPAVQYARLVRGNSVSNRIKDGDYAIFVRMDSFPSLRRGMLVDVERIRSGMREHTVKVYQVTKLVTDSAEMDAQEEIPLDPGESDCEIRIVGVAVGTYRPLNIF